jgi:hypothetical protein
MIIYRFNVNHENKSFIYATFIIRNSLPFWSCRICPSNIDVEWVALLLGVWWVLSSELVQETGYYGWKYSSLFVYSSGKGRNIHQIINNEYGLSFTLLDNFRENRTFRKLDLFPSSDKGTETPTLLGPFEKANLNHWTRVGVSFPSPEDGNRFSLRNVLFSSI